MKLIRLVLLMLAEDPRELAGLQLNRGQDCEVGPLSKTVLDGTFLLQAGAQLKYRPKRTKSGLIVIPKKIRLGLEQGIEHYSNVLAVALHCKRKITSPFPPVALALESDEDRQFLEGARGILREDANRTVAGTPLKLDLAAHISHLYDRLDGVALLAEALCHDHQTGRFHEFIRIYERAFATGGRGLIEPLFRFLSGTEFGYTSQEIEGWIDIRDGVTHADHRNEILFEGDVAWSGERAMQAAYDVLLNKEEWRSVDTRRREIWKPTQGTSSPSPGLDMFATQGEEWRMRFQIFDEFGRFPYNLRGNLQQLPANWWSGSFLLEDEATPDKRTSVIPGKAEIRKSEDTADV